MTEETIVVEPGILSLRPGAWTHGECKRWLLEEAKGWLSLVVEGLGCSDPADRDAYRNLAAQLDFTVNDFIRALKCGAPVRVSELQDAYTSKSLTEQLSALARIVAARPTSGECFADQEPYEELAKELARRLATVEEPKDELAPLLPLEEDASAEDAGEEAVVEPLELHLLPLPDGLVDGEMTPERAQTWLCNELADWLGACRHPLMDQAYSDAERDSFSMLNMDADRLASACARSVRDGSPFALTQIASDDIDYPSTVKNLMDLVKHQRLSHSTNLVWEWCFDDLGAELQRRLEHVQIITR